MIITALVFLTILSVLVLIHELGHFLVARKLGIKVEEFGFGFPPRVFGFKKGETLYSINLLPIGGFVKLYGEDEAGGGRVVQGAKLKVKTEDEERAFFAKTPWQRAAVVVAGVVMNVFLAVVIFYAFMFLSGFKAEFPLLSAQKFVGANQCTVTGVTITDVAAGSPAENIGLVACSSVLSINNEKIKSGEQMVKIINDNKGKDIIFSWKDGWTGTVHTKHIVPRVNPPAKQGAIGVAIGYSPILTAVLSYDTPTQRIFSGFTHTWNVLVWNIGGLGGLIEKAISQKNIAPVGQAVGGPIAIGAVVGVILSIEDVRIMILQLLNLAGILSVSLAFFNILPIPALDGGRLFFILIEAVSGRKVPARIEGYIHSAGMIVLLAFILLVTFQDITRIFSGGIFK